MAEKIKVWFDRGDFLEVRFSDAPGFMRETAHNALMERVDEHGQVVGFSILGVSRFRKERPFEAEWRWQISRSLRQAWKLSLASSLPLAICSSLRAPGTLPFALSSMLLIPRFERSEAVQRRTIGTVIIASRGYLSASLETPKPSPNLQSPE